MSTSEPPQKKQRRDAGTDNAADGRVHAGADKDAAAWVPTTSVPPAPAPAAAPAATDAERAVVQESAPQPTTDTAREGHPAHETSYEREHASTADAVVQSPNELAHILLAQAAESSARMLSNGDAAPSASASTGGAQDASLARQPAAEDGTPTLPEAAGLNFDALGTSAAQSLSHPRLDELDLQLLQISHGEEPRRFGLICRQCCTAVKPNQLSAHLTRKDSHVNFKSKTKRAMMAKTLVSELLEIIASLLHSVGADPQHDLGGMGASSLLSFEDFFGPAAIPSEARPALPPLKVKSASKCQRCFKLVSSSHKKAHRVDDHDGDSKNDVPFQQVQVQELARNGGVLFQVLDDALGDDPPQPAAVSSSELHHGEPAESEQDLVAHDHRQALSTVLSAITAASAGHHHGLDALSAANGSGNDSHLFDGQVVPASASETTTQAVPPPPAPALTAGNDTPKDSGSGPGLGGDALTVASEEGISHAAVAAAAAAAAAMVQTSQSS